jgi:hypothetical protein
MIETKLSSLSIVTRALLDCDLRCLALTRLTDRRCGDFLAEILLRVGFFINSL